MTRTRTFEWMVQHSKSTFVLMSLAFIAFGVLSVNLVMYVAANANYLLTYRWTGLVDGGGQQLVELWLMTFAALGCYLVFKLCEHALIERIAHQSNKAQAQTSVAEVVETDADATLH